MTKSIISSITSKCLPLGSKVSRSGSQKAFDVVLSSRYRSLINQFAWVHSLEGCLLMNKIYSWTVLVYLHDSQSLIDSYAVVLAMA